MSVSVLKIKFTYSEVLMMMRGEMTYINMISIRINGINLLHKDHLLIPGRELKV